MIKKTVLSESDIVNFINDYGCFDLQFRRDVKHKRPNKPVYYSWKTQFVIMSKDSNKELLEEIQNTFNCGTIHYVRGNQLRYSVQDINNLYSIIVPFLKRYPLSGKISGKKQKDFELWADAVQILYQHKGQSIISWHKRSFQQLIDIQKAIQGYKVKKGKKSKWISIAEEMVSSLK